MFFKKANLQFSNQHFTITNFWPMQTPEDLWFVQFINARKIKVNKHLHFISVFGGKPKISNHHCSVFFTGENTDNGYWRYKNYLLNNVNMALGFKYLQHPNYLRFPQWLITFIPPTANGFTIRELLNKLNYCTNFYSRPYKYALIASHDNFAKKRRKIVAAIQDKEHILFAGKYQNNTMLLKENFNNNKIEFLKNVQFNICPENSNAAGYVTEKIFDAVQAGCVPIYWGSNNNPEPEVLNKDAIIFFDEKSNINNEINDMITQKKNVATIPKFLPTATDYITDKLDVLEKKLQDILR